MSNSRRDAWGFSIFCDDIREEVGGKFSLMGIYQNDMIFPVDFPVTVPKFVILVKYYETPDVLKDDLVLRVHSPGDEKDKPGLIQSIPRVTAVPDNPNAFKSRPIEDDQERIRAFTFPIVFSPFLFKQEGYIKVRMQCGELITNLGSLWIHNAPPAEQPKAG